MIFPNRPILIAGAGPVGLSLALALSRAGIPAEVFEPRRLRYSKLGVL